MSDEESVEDEVVEVIFQQQEIESSEEPPMEEWSSLINFFETSEVNLKRELHKQGLYEPPSEDVCVKYIPLSDSSVYRHQYYKYPAVLDPGVEEALLCPKPEFEYPDDGQLLYLAICKEMNEVPCRLFLSQLLKPHMNLSYYGISTLGCRPMAMALMHNKFVQSIDFTQNYISLDGLYHLGGMLAVNDTIVELNFHGCKMGPNGVKTLIAKIIYNRTLRKLNLSKNAVGDEGVEHLMKQYEKGAHITDISLSYNDLTSKSMLFIAEAVDYNGMLERLDLSWNRIAVPRHLEELVNKLIERDNFVEIDLSWNALTNRFARALKNLVLVPNLEVLKLRNNVLSDQTIAGITDNLILAKKLHLLDLSCNPLSVLDAKLLLRSMARRKVKLQTLLLDNVIVDENFVKMRQKILNMKFRANAVITYGYVNPTFTTTGVDLREVVLSRAQVVCRKPKKFAVDVGVMILDVNKSVKGVPIPLKDLGAIFKRYGAYQMDEGLIESISMAFPGASTGKFVSCDIAAMAEYVHRKWPEAKPTPTPPPTPPPELLPLKGKSTGKGKQPEKKENKKTKK